MKIKLLLMSILILALGCNSADPTHLNFHGWSVPIVQGFGPKEDHESLIYKDEAGHIKSYLLMSHEPGPTGSEERRESALRGLIARERAENREVLNIEATSNSAGNLKVTFHGIPDADGYRWSTIVFVSDSMLVVRCFHRNVTLPAYALSIVNSVQAPK